MLLKPAVIGVRSVARISFVLRKKCQFTRSHIQAVMQCSAVAQIHRTYHRIKQTCLDLYRFRAFQWHIGHALLVSVIINGNKKYDYTAYTTS